MFFNFIKNKLIKIRQLFSTISNINQRFDEIKINQGLILSKLNENKYSNDIRDYEYKIFSQWGEDGIIQHLTKLIEIKNKTFIEFGVEDFFESNCRFLLMKDDWKGFVIDGSSQNIQRLKNSYFYWKYNLIAVDKFITKDNINETLMISDFEEDLGILSIDLDGNDYYILEAIVKFKPRILICEYNPYFGNSRKITVPYRDDFHRSNAHYSNLYFGASLAALTYLAKLKGYSLVGTGSIGNNAFYVRDDLLNDKLRVLSVSEAYLNVNFRESKDEQGCLSFLSSDKRFDLIKGLPVFDVERQILESI